MKLRNTLILAASALAFSMGTAAADMNAPGDIMIGVTAKGKVLSDAHGMTLYTFDKDKKGISNCNGGCAAKWPPLMVSKMAKDGGDFTIIKRKDASRQWAYKGMPLYTWIKDKAKGDVTGDGVKGVWHLARP